MYPHIEAVQGFIDGMIEMINGRPDLRDDCGLRDDSATWLKDFKTIGYKCPRQCGGTFILDCDFLKHDDAILVVPNQAARESFRDAFTFDRKYIPYLHSGDDTSLPQSVVRRVITQSELLNRIIKNYNFTVDINRIYIQNSSAFFKAVRRDKFYNWLADIVKFDGFIICNGAM